MKINLYTMFGNRELDFCPKHFVPTSTPITEENIVWIWENLKGRFYLEKSLDFLDYRIKPYFEDPQEAVLYELTWS